MGKTTKSNIYNYITQGAVFGPILCSNQKDAFGKECLEEGKQIDFYRGEVEIPPLSMIDNLICLSQNVDLQFYDEWFHKLQNQETSVWCTQCWENIISGLQNDDENDKEIADDEEECEKEGRGQVHHPGEAVGEPPRQGNSPHRAGVLPAKLGGEEPGWGGAYEETCIGSTAPCKAGPHIHRDEEPVNKEDVKDEVKNGEENVEEIAEDHAG